jgi:hypothetical protein
MVSITTVGSAWISLGFKKKCLLYVSDRKLSDLHELIILVLENSTAVKVRTLAKVSGKIIAMSPALGFVTQVMTRCIFSVLNLKDDWNQIININYHNNCIRELVFWKLNIFDFKPASLLEKTSIFTDASDSGAVGFIQNTFVMHKSWSEVEAVKSSTWRN